MSYINIREVRVPNGAPVLAVSLTDKPTHSLTDGEELAAASAIIDLVDALDNGEALVITRDIF